MANRHTMPTTKRNLHFRRDVAGETYIVICDATAASIAKARRSLVRWAEDKELAFTWVDAGRLWRRIVEANA